MNTVLKRITVTFLMALFFFNTTFPFLANYDPQSLKASTKEISSVFGDKILICTNDGFKWISTEDIQTGKEIPQKHKKYQCALCFITKNTSINSYLTIQLYTAVEFPPEKIYSPRPFLENYKDSDYLYSFPSRAPPLFS